MTIAQNGFAKEELCLVSVIVDYKDLFKK